MSLHPNWKSILVKDWLMVLATLLTGCEAVINAFDLSDWGIPPTIKALLLFLIVAGAFITRLIVIRDKKQ